MAVPLLTSSRGSVSRALVRQCGAHCRRRSTSSDVDGEVIPVSIRATHARSALLSPTQRDLVFQRIRAHVAAHAVYLYIKGTPERPTCGYSHQVVKIMRNEGVEFAHFNVLTDDAVRQGIKEFRYGADPATRWCALIDAAGVFTRQILHTCTRTANGRPYRRYTSRASL